MDPEEFKQRFIKALPEVSAELNLGLDEFYQFPKISLLEYELGFDDLDLLHRIGLPKRASPFFSL